MSNLSWTSCALGACTIALAMLALPPADAAAQGAIPPACQGGRVVSDATAGRCCWPNQTFSDQTGRCSGPPACPAGMVASGDECVSEVPQAPGGGSSPSGQQQVVTPQPYAQVPAQVYVPQQQAEPQFEDTGETRPNKGLIIAGAAMFGGGYIGSVFIGAFALDIGGDDHWNTMFIPLVGAAICAGECVSDGTGSLSPRLFLILDSVVQTAGVVLFSLGFALQSPVQRRVTQNDGLDFTVAPWFTADGAGLNVVGTNF